MKSMKVRLTLVEEMLGTKAANAEVFATFIASKKPDGDPAKDELDRAESREENGTTVFHRDPDGAVGIYDYQIKGFFKDACGALRRVGDTSSAGLKAYKGVIDGLIFPAPRFIRIKLPDGGRVGICERPLRAETMQGPRVSVCRSETIPVGSVIEFDITLLQETLGKVVRDWLDYGKLRGLGQWRNSGKGRFEWEEVK
jgi:hypothetical protein